MSRPIQVPQQIHWSGRRPLSLLARLRRSPRHGRRHHEAEALGRAQAGDHHAFAQLYSLHKRRIYSLCLRMVGNIGRG